MRTRRLTVGVYLGVYALLSASAQGQPSTDASDRSDIERIVTAFIDSVTSTGISEFQGLAFPCYIIIPGEDEALAAIESARDLDKPGERVAFKTRDLSITIAGQVAIASLQFKPEEADQWANAMLMFSRPAGFWTVQVIGFSPNRMLLDSDVDSIRALRADFVRSITTDGILPFDGLTFPLVLANGRAGTIGVLDDPGKLAAGGDAVPLRARNEKATYADSMAVVTMELVSPDDELTGTDVAALACVKTSEGWRVTAVMVGPGRPSADGPGLGVQ